MKTKNICKALALAILLPTLLLNTACSSEIINNENTDGKGFALPVTVNVSRQGDDPATKATYNASTRKLEFSTGDKLFVKGTHTTAGQFAGTLTWTSGGTFSGTITTENEWTGTADALFTAATKINAYLLPAGYESIGFLTISTWSTPAQYDDNVSVDYSKAFALTLAAGIEQLSLESAYAYSSGFALTPVNAILNFTISGLTASTEVTVVFSDSHDTVDKKVTTDASGNAKFVVGVLGTGAYTNIQNCTLTVGGKSIALASGSKTLVKGTIYNISRSAAPAYTLLSAATTADYGKVVCSDGHLHDAKTAVPAGCIAVGILGKVTSTGHGLILALQDATSQSWNTINGWSSVESYAGTTLKQLPDDAARGSLPSYTTLGSTPVSNWCVAQKSDYEAIFTNLGSTKVYDGSTTYDDHVNAFITTGVGGSALIMSTDSNDRYWSATSFSGDNAWYCRSAWWDKGANDLSSYIRPVLAF